MQTYLFANVQECQEFTPSAYQNEPATEEQSSDLGTGFHWTTEMILLASQFMKTLEPLVTLELEAWLSNPLAIFPCKQSYSMWKSKLYINH